MGTIQDPVERQVVQPHQTHLEIPETTIVLVIHNHFLGTKINFQTFNPPPTCQKQHYPSGPCSVDIDISLSQQLPDQQGPQQKILEQLTFTVASLKTESDKNRFPGTNPKEILKFPGQVHET